MQGAEVYQSSGASKQADCLGHKLPIDLALLSGDQLSDSQDSAL